MQRFECRINAQILQLKIVHRVSFFQRRERLITLTQTAVENRQLAGRDVLVAALQSLEDRLSFFALSRSRVSRAQIDLYTRTLLTQPDRFLIRGDSFRVHYKGFNPWDRISDPGAVRALLAGAGVEDAEVVQRLEHARLVHGRIGGLWFLGTGYRGTVEQLDADGRERVRRENLDFIRQADVHLVEANVVYAVALRTPAMDN